MLSLVQYIKKSEFYSCYNPRSVYYRSAAASYADTWLTSWQWGDTGFSPPTAAVKFVWAIHLTTLEDGKILANIC